MRVSIIYSLLFFLASLQLSAQIALTAEMLPQAGDTMLYAIDNLPSGIDLGEASGNQRWDFTTLQSPYTTQVTWQTADKGLAANRFPDADLVVQLTEASEGYYKKDRKEGLLMLGTYGLDPFQMGFSSAYYYTPPVVERHARLKYNDHNHSKSELNFKVAASQLPASTLEYLPITPDSFRISMHSQRTDEADAWGRMVVPGGFYDVIREKRTEVRDVRLEARISKYPWQDITDMLPENPVFGQQTFISYHFFSNETRETIAIAEMKPDGKTINRVKYKASDYDTNVQSLGNLKPGLYAFPNPAIVNVRFQFAQLPPGTYTLSILNILGLEVWSREYVIQGDMTEKVDISQLRKGTYLYNLKDASGKSITTKRLVVVRP